MSGDLDGVLVVSLDQAVAAPYAASRLADAGARVIKVERAEGDFARNYDHLVNGESAYFVWLNRGKESIAADLKDPADLALVRRMVERADIFIQNLAPGAAERLGLGWEALSALNPRLIHASISGYGGAGPYAKKKAYDLLVQAESGLCSVTGWPDRPSRVGVSVCDIATGMHLHAAILQALIARARHGRGRRIEVSLFDAMADLMTVPYLQMAYGDHEFTRTGLSHPTIAPYGAFACEGDALVLLSVQNDREFARLAEALFGDDALARDSRFCNNSARVANRPALDGMIEARTREMSAAAFIALLDGAGVANARISTIHDLIKHPQLRLVRYATPSGPIETIAPPTIVDGAAADAYRATPALDAHGAALRAEFAA